MGVSLFGRSSTRASENTLAPGDPNPALFTVGVTEQRGDYTIAMIHYPGARNYGGKKLAVYHAPASLLRAATMLDPHFSDRRGPLVPLARFEPTDRGYTMALAVVAALRNGQ